MVSPGHDNEDEGEDSCKGEDGRDHCGAQPRDKDQPGERRGPHQYEQEESDTHSKDACSLLFNHPTNYTLSFKYGVSKK